MNNHNFPHITPQPLQHTPIPHDLLLFSPPPLFLNSPPTTVPATRLSFSENHQCPNALPSCENRCYQSPNALPSSENHHSPDAFSFPSENRCSAIHAKAFLKITSPSTKDVPILTGKHDWGTWNTAVWTLIDCSNLLRHVHDSMLLDALYDLDLEPLFPPVVTHASPQHEKDLYLDW
jgi:hypothetical protein